LCRKRLVWYVVEEEVGVVCCVGRGLVLYVVEEEVGVVCCVGRGWCGMLWRRRLVLSVV